MSFWPLATSLVEALAVAQARAPLIELGVGSGEFGARLASCGIQVLGLDRDASARGCALLADVRQLPFRAHAVGGFVAANLLRHLSTSELSKLARSSARCARPGATFVVLEDDPEPIDAANANYLESLRLLAALDPSRGVTLDLESGLRLLSTHWPSLIAKGRTANAETVKDPQLPLRWLRAHGENGIHARRIEKLSADVASAGMSYGNFWYLVLQCV